MSSTSKPHAQAKLKKTIAINLSKHESKGQNDQVIHSIGSARDYSGCISAFLKWRLDHSGIPQFAPITTAEATYFLDELSVQIQQSSLDQYHNALQIAMGAKLARHTSDLEDIRKSRVIYASDLYPIIERMSERHAFTTILIAHTGMRASEIYELRFEDELEPSKHRNWSKDCFAGRGDLRRMVIENGKGGLHRPVGLNDACFTQLMKYKLPEKKWITDRGVDRQTWFDLPGGQRISQAFSEASSKALHESMGIHGLRHSYAQARYAVLRKAGYSHVEALSIITQELGHFRSDITLGYFR